MADIFSVNHFQFPYTDYRFPGMNEGERILFVTRESDIVYKMRLAFLLIVAALILVLGFVLINVGVAFVSQLSVFIVPLVLVVAIGFVIGWWFITVTYRKSLFIITTRRLTKIIYTTPFTWYQFSLGLDEIEDTGSYGASFFEALFGLGYFVARSGAAAIKNFKIVNITYARDLHNYVNKLLYAFKHHPDKVKLFRPFVPHLKPGERDQLFSKHPEYQTEFE